MEQLSYYQISREKLSILNGVFRFFLTLGDYEMQDKYEFQLFLTFSQIANVKYNFSSDFF